MNYLLRWALILMGMAVLLLLIYAALSLLFQQAGEAGARVVTNIATMTPLP